MQKFDAIILLLRDRWCPCIQPSENISNMKISSLCSLSLWRDWFKSHRAVTRDQSCDEAHFNFSINYRFEFPWCHFCCCHVRQCPCNHQALTWIVAKKACKLDVVVLLFCFFSFLRFSFSLSLWCLCPLTFATISLLFLPASISP